MGDEERGRKAILYDLKRPILPLGYILKQLYSATDLIGKETIFT